MATRRYLFISALLLALVVLGTQPRAAQAEQFSLVPAVPSVAAGSEIEFTGSGFMPGERVSLWYTSPRQSVLGGGYADTLEDGRFNAGFKLPSEAIGGVWAATAYGEISRVPVIATFTVIGQEPREADLLAAVAPGSAPAGTTLPSRQLASEILNWSAIGSPGQMGWSKMPMIVNCAPIMMVESI